MSRGTAGTLTRVRRRALRSRGERGSATVYALALMTLLVAATMLAAGLVGMALAKHRAAAAADLAALAGASQPTDGCARARLIASRNGAELRDCVFDGERVTVTVTVSAPGALGYKPRVHARARAGPATSR